MHATSQPNQKLFIPQLAISTDESMTGAQLLSDAASLYRRALRSAPEAIDYLKARGISGASAARFCLGYAGPGAQKLAKMMAPYGPHCIQDSGLKVQKNNRHIDIFRSRIMFPIRTISGHVVGFGGRSMNDLGPKYFNSPEGPNFRKRALLYGLFEGREAIESKGFAVVVEGFFDVISLAQSGLDNVVSTLGTACTKAQVLDLLKITSRIVFCFDGDDAGRKAAARALEIVLPLAREGVEFEFAFLPAGEDPDSFVRRVGHHAMLSILEDSLPLEVYLISLAVQGLDLSFAEGVAAFSVKASRYWRQIPAGDLRDCLFRRCAEWMGFSADELASVWLNYAWCREGV